MAQNGSHEQHQDQTPRETKHRRKSANNNNNNNNTWLHIKHKKSQTTSPLGRGADNVTPKNADSLIMAAVVPKASSSKDCHQVADEAKQMKQKYQNVKKLKVEGDDEEVFESVNDAHPVFSATLLRKGKGIKWKDDETPAQSKEKEATQKKKEHRKKNAEKMKNEKEDDGDSTPKKMRKKHDKEKEEKEEKEKENSLKLRNKIEQLEKENDELKKKLQEVQKILKKRNSKDKEETPESEEMVQLSIKTLTIMKKNQILDTVLDLKSNRILYNFFRKCETPTEEIATLVENALTRGLKYMVNCSDQISDVIDNQLRTFICNTNLAKKTLLKTMFDHPDLIPDMWGGGPMLAKLRKEKLEASHDDVHNT